MLFFLPETEDVTEVLSVVHMFPFYLHISANAENRLVEGFREGYPQFSALLGTRAEFRVFRRFANVRMRLLLYKQDKISALEAGLVEIDKSETRTLFLGTRRGDRNDERTAKLIELDTAIAEYGEQVMSGT